MYLPTTKEGMMAAIGHFVFAVVCANSVRDAAKPFTGKAPKNSPVRGITLCSRTTAPPLGRLGSPKKHPQNE